MQARELFYAQK